MAPRPKEECDCCWEVKSRANMRTCGQGHKFCKECINKTMAKRNIAINTDSPRIFIDCIFLPACVQKIPVIRKRRNDANQNQVNGWKHLLHQPDMSASKRRRF